MHPFDWRMDPVAHEIGQLGAAATFTLGPPAAGGTAAKSRAQPQLHRPPALGGWESLKAGFGGGHGRPGCPASPLATPPAPRAPEQQQQAHHDLLFGMSPEEASAGGALLAAALRPRGGCSSSSGCSSDSPLPRCAGSGASAGSSPALALDAPADSGIDGSLIQQLLALEAAGGGDLLGPLAPPLQQQQATLEALAASWGSAAPGGALAPASASAPGSGAQQWLHAMAAGGGAGSLFGGGQAGSPPLDGFLAPPLGASPQTPQGAGASQQLLQQLQAQAAAALAQQSADAAAQLQASGAAAAAAAAAEAGMLQALHQASAHHHALRHQHSAPSAVLSALAAGLGAPAAPASPLWPQLPAGPAAAAYHHQQQQLLAAAAGSSAAWPQLLAALSSPAPSTGGFTAAAAAAAARQQQAQAAGAALRRMSAGQLGRGGGAAAAAMAPGSLPSSAAALADLANLVLALGQVPQQQQPGAAAGSPHAAGMAARPRRSRAGRRSSSGSACVVGAAGALGVQGSPRPPALAPAAADGAGGCADIPATEASAAAAGVSLGDLSPRAYQDTWGGGGGEPGGDAMRSGRKDQDGQRAAAAAAAAAAAKGQPPGPAPAAGLAAAGGCPAWFPLRAAPGAGAGAGLAAAAAAEHDDAWYLPRPATCRLFVGNIGSWVDEDLLLSYFSAHGRVVDVQVMWNTKMLSRGRRVNREFAFVSYETPLEAARAVHWLDGCRLPDMQKDANGITVEYENGEGDARGGGGLSGGPPGGRR